MKTKLLLLFLLCFGAQAAEKVLYETNFETAKPGPVPEELMVLEGGFEVKEDQGNKFLELPGAPLETFGVMFGPSEKENIAASARIFGSKTGRRFPAFSVGLNGVGGFRLQVSPAKKKVELLKGDEAVAEAPYDWKSESWTRLLLQIRKTGEAEWKIEGKVWPDGQEAPANWIIAHTEKEPPVAGKALVFGLPFSGVPIRFDDLKVSTVQ